MKRKILAGLLTLWDKACTAGPVTGLKILEELKERPVREAPYAPMDLYAKWETQES